MSDSILQYDDIADLRLNPFDTDESTKWSPKQIGYGSNDPETRTVPVSSPYQIKLFEYAQENAPSTTMIVPTAGGAALEEVAKTVTPGDGQYRVNYDELGTAIIEFSSAQAGVQMDISYYGLGTVLQKIALDTRVPSTGSTTISGVKTFDGAIVCNNISGNFASYNATTGAGTSLIAWTTPTVKEFIILKPVMVYVDFNATSGGGDWGIYIIQNSGDRVFLVETGTTVKYGIVLLPGQYKFKTSGYGGVITIYGTGVYGVGNFSDLTKIIIAL